MTDQTLPPEQTAQPPTVYVYIVEQRYQLADDEDVIRKRVRAVFTDPEQAHRCAIDLKRDDEDDVETEVMMYPLNQLVGEHYPL